VAALPRPTASMAAPVASAPAPVKSATAPVINAVRSSAQIVWASAPRGEGDPEGITCRTPQLLPGSRLRGPELCQANKVWAQLAANHQVVLPDGKTIVATGLKSEACGAARQVGVNVVTATTPGNNGKTTYTCN